METVQRSGGKGNDGEIRQGQGADTWAEYRVAWTAALRSQ